MAKTTTMQIALGFKAPNFQLLDTLSGKERTRDELKGKQATVVMFICNHCPFVQHVIEGLVKLANDYIPRGVSFIAINANDVKNYPNDSPENMKKLGEHYQFSFPYLYDATQEVAKAYHAACTPDFNIFDNELQNVYRGQLDDARPGNDIPVTGKDIRAALDAILAGKEVDKNQKPSTGCSIKWKK